MDRETEIIALQYAANRLQTLLDSTCNHCRGSDVRLDIEAMKRKIEQDIDRLDGKDN